MIMEYCEYLYTGFDVWSFEMDDTDDVFDLVKSYFTAGNTPGYSGGTGNALLGGSIVQATNAGSDNNVINEFCYMHSCFDGSKMGDFINSVTRFSVFRQCMDDGAELESSFGSTGDGIEFHDNRFINCWVGLSHQDEGLNGQQYAYRNVFEITDPDNIHPPKVIKMIRTGTGGRMQYYHNYFKIVNRGNNPGFGTNTWIWYDFNNGTADRIKNFINNIIDATDTQGNGINSGSGPEPVFIDNNIVAAPSAETAIQGPNGAFAGSSAASLGLNGDLSLQSGSICRNAARALPAGFPDSRSGAGANDDVGPFPFGETPGTDWPRPASRLFTTDLPARWTSPGA